MASVVLDLLLLTVGLWEHMHITSIMLTWLLSNLIHYPVLESRRYVSYFQVVILALKQLLTFLVLYVLFQGIYAHVSYDLLFWDLLKVLSVIVISRVLFVSIVRVYRLYGYGFNRFLIIGDSLTMQKLTTSLISKKGYGNIKEDVMISRDFEAIENMIKFKNLNEIYCSSSAISSVDLAELMSLTIKYGIQLYVVSDEGQDGDDISSLSLIPGYLNAKLETYPLTDQKNRLLKRLMDIILSILVIVLILSWMIPLLGILIKLESKGPIFFLQPRAGKNGKYFWCIKFRSMKDKGDFKQATKNDDRVTKLGSFIRRTSIDELPQFINVLLGQMSIVGPRPHVKFLNDKFNSEVDQYYKRLLVKPGITGLSQVSGHRGETKDNQSMLNRVRLDLLYIKKWSVWLDLIVIFRTVTDQFLGKKENAY